LISYRKHGVAPYRIGVVHGGPGAPGSIAPVAREIAVQKGVIEPFQTKDNIPDLVEELKICLEIHATLPVILVGHSWGAWLSCMFASNHPSFVSKLLLIGSGPFEIRFSHRIMDIRLKRLSNQERIEVKRLTAKLKQPHTQNQSDVFEQFACLMYKADMYDPLPYRKESIGYNPEIFQRVWEEAKKIRENGTLIDSIAHITCPVVALHGDFDPHPGNGVKIPLSRHIEDFRYVELKNCGHYPWMEKQAKNEFYSKLRKELYLD